MKNINYLVVVFAFLASVLFVIDVIKDVRDADANTYMTSEISEIVDIKQGYTSDEIIVRTKDKVYHFNASKDYVYLNKGNIEIGKCVVLSIKVVATPNYFVSTAVSMDTFVNCPEGVK